MEELLKSAALLILGGVIQFLVARFNKTKKERELGMAGEYLKLVDMSGDQLEKRINLISKLETRIDAQSNTIDELKVKIQSDLMETRDLRADYATAQKQINRLEEIVIRQSEYIDDQNTVMKDAGMPVKMNGELMDSVRRLKLTREQREQLKGKP